MVAGDRLLGASFRGVPFFVPNRTQSGGRRGDTHEFPQRDRPDGDDMGRKARSFRVDAQVFGDLSVGRDSYMSARDALLTALEAPGAGVYVDPWRGRQSVIARAYDLIETISEGGVAKFTITFEEEGQTLFPSVGIDTAAGVVAAADALSASSLAAFADGFSLDGVPQFVRADAQLVLDALAADVSGLVAGLPGAVPAAGESLPGIAGALDAFSVGAPGLVSGADAPALGGAVADLFAGLRVSIAGPTAAGRVFGALNGFGGGLAVPPETTATRRRQSANRTALLGLVGDLALAGEAKCLAKMSFDSADAAEALRASFLTRLDAARVAAGRAGSSGVFRDGVFAALSGVRGAVIKDVSSRAQGLPRLRRIQTPSAVPSVVLAHRLYGDGSRADEIMARNPGFVHGGKVPGFLGVSVLDG